MKPEDAIAAAFFILLGVCLYYFLLGGWYWFSDWRERRNWKPISHENTGFIDVLKYTEKARE